MKPPPKRVSNDRQTRPPLNRMLRIHQEVQAQKFPNSGTLGRELEISTKTVHRDVEFMRDQLNLPIEWDGAKNGYFYTRPVTNFPTMHFTEGELVALVVAEKALQQYRGTTFEKPLLSAIKKMEESLPDTISLSLSDVHQTISFRTSAEQILDLEIFDALAKATAAQRQIEFAYRKPGQQQTEQRRVDLITSQISTVNGTSSLTTNSARTFAHLFPPASNPSNKPARHSRASPAFLSNSACATASASIPEKTNSRS